MADPGPPWGERWAKNAFTFPRPSSGRTSEESKLSSMPRSSSSRSNASGWGARSESIPALVLAPEKRSQSRSFDFWDETDGSGGITAKLESEDIADAVYVDLQERGERVEGLRRR